MSMMKCLATNMNFLEKASDNMVDSIKALTNGEYGTEVVYPFLGFISY